MTWEALLVLLESMNSYSAGKELLKQPIVISNHDKTRFLMIGAFEVLNDMGRLCVLTSNTKVSNDK